MSPAHIKADESILAQLVEACADEAGARELLASLRWPNSPVCPNCNNAGQKRISKLEAQSPSQSGVRLGV